jgi:hypothetical protein
MKLNMKRYKFLAGCGAIATAATLLTACSNQDIKFGDFDYQTVYFATQYPVRTLELGEDLYVDTSMDNQHKVIIKATMGGVYKNKQNRIIDITVDNSLCDNLYYAATNTPVVPMPANYYTLASNQITIPSGSIMGGVEVQLTDAFFEDSKSLDRNYVIPLRMTDVQGADSILSGVPLVENPNRCIDSNWSIKPRDYVLYAIKYINQWQGNYLRRGVDEVTDNGTTTTHVRHNEYVENDQVVNVHTKKLTVAGLPLLIYDNNGYAVNYTLTLTFADDGTCTVSGESNDYAVTGSGKFVKKGEKNSMGGKDRDALYLDYKVDFKTLGTQYATKDTLVLRDRGVAPEYYTVEVK